jgi:urea transport system substrate-binding protein
MSKEGGGAKLGAARHRLRLPARRTRSCAFLKSKGVAEMTSTIHAVRPQRLSDDHRGIKKFAAGGKAAMISTINGDSSVPFTRSS